MGQLGGDGDARPFRADVVAKDSGEARLIAVPLVRQVIGEAEVVARDLGDSVAQQIVAFPAGEPPLNMQSCIEPVKYAPPPQFGKRVRSGQRRCASVTADNEEPRTFRNGDRTDSGEK